MDRNVYSKRRRYLPLFLAGIGAIIFINLFGTMTFQASALRFSLTTGIRFPGSTSFSIPPIGEIHASTHSAPLQLVVTLQNIDMDILKAIGSAKDQDIAEHIIAEVQTQAQKIIIAFVMKMVLLGGLGGLFGVFISKKASLNNYLAGLVIGCLLVFTIFCVGYITYDVTAFENPQYQGILQAAPWMVNLIQESFLKVEELGQQIQSLANNLYQAFKQIEGIQPIGQLEADLLVLHVSDIHNNPVAYDFVRQIIDNFAVDLIIDTGDLTDWGTPLEAELVNQIETLGVPYVFTTGNHDSPDVVDRLAATENVVLITDRSVEVKGLKISGISDVAADSYSPTPPPISTLDEIARTINEKYRNQDDVPDIFGVHNNRIALAIEPGVFPVILFGHNHVLEVVQKEETMYINAGTTGASGIRGFQARTPTPFSLGLLYFLWCDQSQRFILNAVDGIQVQGLRSTFSFTRTFVERRNHIDDVEILE